MDHSGHDHLHNTPSPLTSTASPFYGDKGDNHNHGAAASQVADHNHNSGDHMMMSMFFHGGYSETILFSFWKIDTIGGLLGSMIGMFLMSMLYEGLKVLREYLLQRSLAYGPSHLSADNISGLRAPLATDGNRDTPDGSSTHEIVKTFLRPHPFSFSHTLQTLLHMLQVFMSYLLMLVFMTYNVWLGLAVILGAGAGYFVFGWRKRTVVDINEHCH